jgi:hypothetical protein
MTKYLLLILLFSFSCTKDKIKPPPQTIYPLSYLPVYPGSSWKYINENNDTVVYSTETDYKLHSYKSNGSQTDPAYVPIWNGKPVYGYSTPQQITSPAFSDEYRRGLTLVKYVSATEGENWTVYHEQYGSHWRVVIKIDTSITIGSLHFDHVIVVNDSSAAYAGPTFLIQTSYYARDVGLIREDDKATDSTLYQHLRISSYSIKR